MRENKFSILIACYNQRHFVQAAVESAIAQSSPSREIIVVDDCSTDGTADILDQYRDSVQLVKFEENQGAIASRNHAAKLATGEYLVYLDGDDIFMPWTLQVYQRLINAHKPEIILGKRSYFRGEDPKTDSIEFPEKLEYITYQNWFQKEREVAFGASNFVVHRKAFNDVGGWSPGIFHLDMTDLLLKLGLSGETIVILSPETVWYRKHSANVTLSIAGMLECSHVLLEKEKKHEYPGGSKHRFARCTLLGGPMLSWILRAFKARFYDQALKLAWPSASIILGAIIRRTLVQFKRRWPLQTLMMKSE